MPDAVITLLKDLDNPDVNLGSVACRVDSYATHPDRHVRDWTFSPCMMRDTYWNPTSYCYVGPRIARFPQLEKLYRYLNNRLADQELVRSDILGSYPDYNVTSVRCMLGGSRFIQTLKCLEVLTPEPNRLKPETGQVFESEFSLKMHLVWASRPDIDDDMGKVALQLRTVNFSEEKWMQTIIRNPLWSKAVALLLELPGLESLAWWYYAHGISCGDPSYNKFEEFNFSSWTEYSAEDFRNRRFDFQWLARIAETLDHDVIYTFIGQAKNVDEYMFERSPAREADRLHYLTEAHFGQVSRATVFKRATVKRHQDSIQAVGILKLAEGASQDEDLSQRLQVLRSVRTTKNKVGAQRKDNERQQIAFALDALTYQAGFNNRHELWWISEVEEIELLCGEPVGVRLDDLKVELVLQDNGSPALQVKRKGKLLKAIPAGAKKDIAIAELIHRRNLLTTKHKELAKTLEDAMVNQEDFSAELLKVIGSQTLSAVLIANHAFIEVLPNNEHCGIGFLTSDFQALEDIVSGEVKQLSTETALRLAHPAELKPEQIIKLQQMQTARNGEPFFRQLTRECTRASTEEVRMQVANKHSGKLLRAHVLGGVSQTKGWIMHNASEPCEFRRKFSNSGVAACLVLEGHFFDAQQTYDNYLTLDLLRFISIQRGEVLPFADVSAMAFNEAISDLELFVAKAAPDDLSLD